MQTQNMPKTVILSNQKEIVLNDELDISIVIINDAQISYVYPIPNPSCGYGGGGLFLSASQQYLVFSYYSGQSSETFLLFKIEENALQLLYDSGDVYGENGDFCFSNQEEYLLQALRTGWWYAGENDEEQIDQAGNKFYEFGMINILNIKEKRLDQHIIHVYPTNEWEIEKNDAGPFEFFKMTDNLLQVIMPWGKEDFALPFQDFLVIKPK